jgi:hypothetical protein
VSEEEKEKAINNIMMGLNLIDLSLLELELFMTGCLTPPEDFMLESWHRRANEALDRNDMDKAIEWTKKILAFLEERQKLCEELRRKSRKHNKHSSRHSSRH